MYFQGFSLTSKYLHYHLKKNIFCVCLFFMIIIFFNNFDWWFKATFLWGKINLPIKISWNTEVGVWD